MSSYVYFEIQLKLLPVCEGVQYSWLPQQYCAYSEPLSIL